MVRLACLTVILLLSFTIHCQDMSAQDTGEACHPECDLGSIYCGRSVDCLPDNYSFCDWPRWANYFHVTGPAGPGENCGHVSCYSRALRKWFGCIDCTCDNDDV